MQFDRVKDFLRYQTHCTFCQCPMPLSFRDWRGASVEEPYISCTIENNCCKLNILRSVTGSLEIDLINNTFSASRYPQNMESLASLLNSKKVYMSRKCHMCNGEFKIQTRPLKFNADNTIDPVLVDNIRFQYVSPEDKTMDRTCIINAYLDNKTTMIHFKVSGEEFLPTMQYYKELPLVPFDFSSKEKIIQKIRTLTLFS